MGIRVNIDFDVDAIFNNEEFETELQDVMRRAVLKAFDQEVGKAAVKIYQDHTEEVSEEILEAYKEHRQKFLATLQES